MQNTILIKHHNLIFLKNIKSHKIVVMLLGSLFIALSAQITIPLSPVPITLQNLAVLLVGALLGPKLGSKVVLLYLLEGVCGMPVFAGFSYGFPVIFGPTGGYLIGYVGAAYISGYLLQHSWSQNYFWIFMSAFFGDIVLFIFGYSILSCFVDYHNAYLLGVMPFYLLELVKLLLFTLIASSFLQKQINV